jgi:predicted transcriptional regulator
MKMSEIAKGIEIKKEERDASTINSKPVSKRRYFWDEDDKINPAIRQPLDSNKTAHESSLDSHKTVEKTATRQPLDSNKTAEYNEITGAEKVFLNYVFSRLEIETDRQTKPITTEEIKLIINKSTNRVKNLVERLVKKGVLNVIKSKRGNGAWRTFSIPEKTIKEMRQEKLIRQQLDSHKTVDWTADKTAIEPIKKGSIYLNNTFILENFPAVQKIGLKENHLLKTSRTEIELIEILTHYEHSLTVNEIRVPQKLPVLISIINDPTKTWVSESYMKQFNDELDANQKRMIQFDQIKKLQADVKLKERYEEFLTQNPEFKTEVQKKQIFKNLTPEVLETICFEEFKTKNPNL